LKFSLIVEIFLDISDLLERSPLTRSSIRFVELARRLLQAQGLPLAADLTTPQQDYSVDYVVALEVSITPTHTTQTEVEDKPVNILQADFNPSIRTPSNQLVITLEADTSLDNLPATPQHL
jgi:hypothetical protein